MNLRDIANVIGIIILVALLLAALSFVAGQPQGQSKAQENFTLLSVGSAGNYGYAIFSYSGKANITLLAFNEKPKKRIVVLRERGVAMDSFDSFAAGLKRLEKSGMQTVVGSPFSDPSNSILLVPTGAMPWYVLDELENGSQNVAVYYIGSKDLVIRNGGVKKENWYSSLGERARSRIHVEETTLDQFVETINESFYEDLLENSWLATGKRQFSYNSAARAKTTASVPASNVSYVRAIIKAGNETRAFDSGKLENAGAIEAEKEVFPWERVSLTFSLNETNGSAHLIVQKDGEEVSNERLQRTSDESLFVKRMQFNQSGDYVIYVKDSSGILAGGMVHVKGLELNFQQAEGRIYIFNASVDGKKISNEHVSVSIGNSTKKSDFFISDGLLKVPAKLEKGTNVFNIELLGTTRHISIVSNFENITDVYINYGIPGIALVVVVYFFARINRRPVYRIRISEGAKDTRKDLKMAKSSIPSIFLQVRNDLGLSGPVTANELSLALKKHVTDGADVTEGNIEEVLKKLESSGAVEHHVGYYQLRGEGDVRKNVLRRMVKEKLIEHGLSFTDRKDRFITKDFEICLGGQDSKKRSLLVFEDANSMRSYLASLNANEQAALRLKQHNGMTKMATVDQLDELL